MSQVNKNIAEYMNSQSTDKKYNTYLVSAIRSAIRREFSDRKERKTHINAKTKEGKLKIDKRIAALINQEYPSFKNVTADDVRLLKKCIALEYTDRTGKCAWGFREIREKLGYDPETGLEVNTNETLANSTI